MPNQNVKNCSRSCKYTSRCAAGIPGIPEIPRPASPASAVESPQGPRGTRGYKGEAGPLAAQGPVGPKGPLRDSREKLERRVIQVLGVPQVPRGFRDRLKDRDVPPVSPLEFDWEFDSSEYFLFFIVSLMFREFSLRCWLFAITFTLVC